MNKRLTVLALWANKLHKNGVCQRNHSLDYRNGWFYYDDEPPFQDPSLTAEAESYNRNGITGKILQVGMSDIYILESDD